MHRPQSHAESTLPVRLWLRTHGRQALALAVLYFLFGHASFLVRVDDVLVTPVLFAPEGIALAMALRFGGAVWPGVFVGQLALALSRGLAPLPAASISAVNSIEVLLAVFLFRAFKLDAGLARARDLAGLLLLIFLVLQPFSATFGNATLWAAGIVDRAQLPGSWVNWWIGNSFGQMLVTPLLLALFAGGRTRGQTVGDFLLPVLVVLPAFWAADYLLRWTGVSSLVVLFAPVLVLLAIYRGLAAVCLGALIVALGALYATSHAFGPFVAAGRADIPGLNLFIIGLALSGQFLAVFLRQTSLQQKLADQLRDARERLQRTAYELTENIPVGTYVLEFDAEGTPRFTFVSERWLKMLDLRREDVLADPTLAMNAVHPDERDEFNRLNAEVFAEKKRFFWEGRIAVRGETRWVTIESIPRTRPGGGTIWEGAMIDITERKRAEAHLRLVLDNLPVAVAENTLSSPAEITMVNEQFTATFGYTPEEVPTVAAWAEKAYPDPVYRREVFREWDEAIGRAVETRGRVESMEFEVTCKDGTKRDTVFHAAALPDRLLVTMSDVTERRQAEAALRSLREKLERTAFELTENIPVGTYTMVQPPAGGMACFSFMSTRFLELTGLDRDSAMSNPMNAFACVHPDDRDEWVRENARVFEHRLPFKGECRIVVNGATRWISAESTPRDRPDGSVVWEGVLTDITDRKLAEQKLAEANRDMQLAASAARLGFWEFDVDTGMDRWDDGMARINGIALDAFDGRWEKFVHPEDYDNVMLETRRMLESDGIFATDYRIRRPDGKVRHVREHGIVTRAADGRPLRAHGVLQDVTEEKEAAARERKLEEAHRRDLETKLKTSLSASAVAHEINQPLSSILLRSKLALESGEEPAGALRLIAEETRRVVVTIEKMKTLLRNVQTEQKPVDLVDVVRSALLYNKSLLARHGVNLQTRGLGDPCRIDGDDAQLQMAITNLLRNAAEAIDEAEAEKREIVLELSAGGDTVELVIGDSGPGWSGAEDHQLPLTTTKKGGTGIGLYVVRTAMENHRGEIAFGRSPLGGAEVRLKFPRTER